MGGEAPQRAKDRVLSWQPSGLPENTNLRASAQCSVVRSLGARVILP